MMPRAVVRSAVQNMLYDVQVEITVHSASGLRNADWSWGKSGGSDAFCVAEVPGTGKCFQTNVVEDSSNPVWNMTQRLQLASSQSLLLSVFDRDAAGKDLLGKVTVTMDMIRPNGFAGKLKLHESGNTEAQLAVTIKLVV